jgi:hypothetical protein
MHCVGRMQSSGMLKQVVYIVGYDKCRNKTLIYSCAINDKELCNLFFFFGCVDKPVKLLAS